MNWIHVKEKHFVDIDENEKGYTWVENNNCPSEPFLIGLNIYDGEGNHKRFEYHLVILSDNGLESWTEDNTEILWLDLTSVEYWCKVEKPGVKPTFSNLKFRAESKEDKDSIQKELFRLGLCWISSSKGSDVIHSIPDDNFLFAYFDPGKMYITCSRDEEHFNRHDHTETTLEELKAM